MPDDCRPTIWPGQLTSGDRYGSYNCAAYVLAKAIEFDTCGDVIITGSRVRQLSSEPTPDPKSPGLHHGQLRDVAAQFGLRCEKLDGAPWDELADARRMGHACCIQIGYRPLRTTTFSGQRTFYSNHELLELPGIGWFTYDPLCDGRASGGVRVFRGPANYPESLLMQAAGDFNTKNGRLGFGRVNVLVLPHRHPYDQLPDTSTPPVVIPQPYDGNERNVAILSAYAGHTFRLSKGQPLYRSPSGPRVTVMARTGSIEYIGKAGAGWVAVKVGTGAVYADGVVRPTVLYCPSGAGVLE